MRRLGGVVRVEGFDTNGVELDLARCLVDLASE